MEVAARIRELIEQSQSEDNAVGWPALRLLGILSERHFTQAVAALEETGHDGGHEACGACEALTDLEETLERISSEISPL